MTSAALNILSHPSKNKTYELMDIKEACVFLNLKESRLRSMVFKKEIPFLKIGATIRFNKGDLLVWLDQQKVEVLRTNYKDF